MEYKNELIGFVLFLGIAITCHCAYIYQPGIKIKVVDKDTKQPITTAVVSNQYTVWYIPEGHNYYGKKLLRTDRNGEVSIRDYFKITWPWEIYDAQGIGIRAVGYIPVGIDIHARDYEYSYDYDASYLVSGVGKLDNNGKKILEYYEQFYKQKFKYFYKTPKNSYFMIMVPEKRMVIRGDEGTIEDITFDKPCKYIEIPIGKIKNEKKYIDIVGHGATDLFEIENIKEFLRQYPESKEKFKLLQWIGDIYGKHLSDKQNAMKYYWMLIKEGNEYLVKNPQKSQDRLKVIFKLESVSWKELKDYELALSYSKMAKEEAIGNTIYIEQDIKKLNNLIKERNSKK